MKLAEFFSRLVHSDTGDIAFTAYDGSRFGPSDAASRIHVRSPLALSYIASAPGELGMARAYVSGELEVHGDMYATLANMPDLEFGDIPADMRLRALWRLGSARFWWPLRRPPQETHLHGRTHSKIRDAEAIAHHYDVSNLFYSYVLGPSMAYTCAAYPSAAASLQTAQAVKFDLVARKLGLREGMRLLDVGCGWGGMVIHAAKHYGVRALGVTLSEHQAQWAQRAIAEAGVSELAQVRHLDYRDVVETGFDAVSSIGLTEHIGAANVPGYFRFLYGKLAAGGRLLNHCITRPNGLPDSGTGPFINRYVFPDGELESPGALVTMMHDTGFDVRHMENLREHYALTLAAWCANLERNWTEAVAEVGSATARIWRLYMAGSRLAFERNFIALQQILGVKPAEGGTAGMPLRPQWEPDAAALGG